MRAGAENVPGEGRVVAALAAGFRYSFAAAGAVIMAVGASLVALLAMSRPHASSAGHAAEEADRG